MPPKARVQAKQQPPPAQQHQLLLLIAAALVIGGRPRVMAAALSGAFASVGISVEALLAALELAEGLKPLSQTVKGTQLVQVTVTKSPMVNSRRQAVMYRAAYIRNASQRIQRDLDDGLPLEDARVKERRYMVLHSAAQQQRENAARRVAAASKQYGPTLGWYSRRDARTSEECRVAHGHNFEALVVPVIGYPGAVHTHCRCWPGPKHQTNVSVDEAVAGVPFEREVA